MPTVIVIPEAEGFEWNVSCVNEACVNKALGVPRLREWKATYFAPYRLKDSAGVNRIYHIQGDRIEAGKFVRTANTKSHEIG